MTCTPWEREGVAECRSDSAVGALSSGLSGEPPPLFAKYAVLNRAWQDTQQILVEAVSLLEHALPGGEVRTVAVSGSLGRMEKTANSDLDLIVVVHDQVTRGPAPRAACKRVYQALRPLGLATPRTDGIFAGPSTQETLCDPLRRGTIAEEPEVFGKRIQWLLDCQPIYGFDAFETLLDGVLKWYAVEFPTDGEGGAAVYLMNDLVRYFRAICVDCQWRGRQDGARWRLRNLKLMHTRLVACGALLLSLGEMSRAGCQHDWLRKQLRCTPLERLVRVFQQYQQTEELQRILASYAHFLACYSDPAFRANLETGVGAREATPAAHPLYRELRGNAEGIQDELVRFMLRQHGVWSDAFFRCLIL
ncbi:MAG: DUF294 nucleotidyltransferase-like domain-containing protein [Planctomycetota bacterium]|nr:DUF294 nucleotidyltransferase-like domain-containing protein [Planctomycetota bacterium]